MNVAHCWKPVSNTFAIRFEGRIIPAENRYQTNRGSTVIGQFRRTHGEDGMNRMATVGLGAVVLTAGIGLWARHRLVLVTVEGSSMEPTLFPGDRVLVHRRGLARVRRGQLVVLEPPLPDGIHRMDTAPAAAVASLDDRQWNIKRAVALPGDPVPPGVAKGADTERVPPGALVVFGDNASSTDSRQRGFYFAADLLGVVVRRMSSMPGQQRDGTG